MSELDSTPEQIKAEKGRIFRERLAKAAAERAAAGIVTAAPVHRNPIERAQHNPKNLRLAIAANCWVCQGQDADPHPRWRIGNCVSTDCPLWPHRPHQKQYQQPIPASLKSSFNDENIQLVSANIQLDGDDDDD